MASIDFPARPGAPPSGGIRLRHCLLAIAGLSVLMAVLSRTGRTAWLLQVPAAMAIGLAIGLVHPARVVQAAIRFYAMPSLLVLTLLAHRLAHPGMLGGLMALMTAFLTASVVCITLADWLTAAHAHDRSRRPGWVAVLLVPIGVVLPFFLALSPWLIDAGFAVSRPGLEVLADRVVAGQRVAWPQRIGVFTVHGSAVDPNTGNVGLVLDPNPSGRTGLLRRPPGGAAFGPFSNLNIDRNLGHGWRFQEED